MAIKQMFKEKFVSNLTNRDNCFKNNEDNQKRRVNRNNNIIFFKSHNSPANTDRTKKNKEKIKPFNVQKELQTEKLENKKGYLSLTIKTPSQYFWAFYKYYKYQLIDLEVSFVMNKLSIASIVCGLMVLGGLFFGSGFFLATKMSFKQPIVINGSAFLPSSMSHGPQKANKTNHPPSPYALMHGNNAMKQQQAYVAKRYSNRSGVVMDYPKHRPSPINLQ